MFGTKKSQTQPEPVETIAAQEHKQSIGNQVMEALGVGENGTGLDEESEILMPKQNQRQLEAEGVVKESVCVISKDAVIGGGIDVKGDLMVAGKVMTQDISQFYEYKGGKYGKAIIGNADTNIIMHLIPSEAKALQEAIQLTSVEMEAVSSLPRGQGLVCSASAKLFVDFVADDYEAKEITTDAKSFYERRKALEKKKREEEEKAAENTVIDVEM